MTLSFLQVCMCVDEVFLLIYGLSSHAWAETTGRAGFAVMYLADQITPQCSWKHVLGEASCSCWNPRRPRTPSICHPCKGCHQHTLTAASLLRPCRDTKVRASKWLRSTLGSDLFSCTRTKHAHLREKADAYAQCRPELHGFEPAGFNDGQSSRQPRPPA